MSKSDTHRRAPDSDEPEVAEGGASDAAAPPEEDGAADPAAPREATDDPDTSKVGMVVDGRYRILSLIGRGGMGSVYRAEHVTIRRTVAVKLLHPALAALPDVGKRFEREAYAIGRIDHPNCVNVSDFGQLEDGSLFLVMEYLEGRSLGDVMADEGRLAPARALRITRHLVRGLGHAHQAGIVHRDVKPENVLLVETDDDPEFAKILDFGIAKLVGRAATESGESDARLTQAGIAFGTPIYMSPEQAVGGQVDGRADLYAATVLLYEMIAGEPPFSSDDKIEVLSMHTSKPVPPLADAAPDVELPEGLEELIARGLAKRSADRFASAADYIAEIDRVLSASDSAHEQIAPSQPGDSGSMQVRSTRRGRGTVPVVYASEPTRTGPGPDTEEVAQPVSRATRAIAAGVLGLVLVVGGIALSSRSGGGAAASGDGGASSVEERPLAERAARLLQRGNPQEAIDLLEDRRDVIAVDGEALLLLGHAYAAKRRNPDALEAYSAALERQPELVADPALGTNLQMMLDSKKADVVLDAIDLLLVTHLASDAAVGKLVAWATEHDDTATRRRALKLADAHNVGDRVDRVKSYSLDLRTGRTCEERREAVAKLRALGDKRAIEPLTRASFIKRGRGRSSRNINSCLREDAEEAVKYLENLTPTDAGPPAEEP